MNPIWVIKAPIIFRLTFLQVKFLILNKESKKRKAKKKKVGIFPFGFSFGSFVRVFRKNLFAIKLLWNALSKIRLRNQMRNKMRNRKIIKTQNYKHHHDLDLEYIKLFCPSFQLIVIVMWCNFSCNWLIQLRKFLWITKLNLFGNEIYDIS